MAQKYECRGYMVSPPKRKKTPCGLPFTTVWGGRQNRPTGKSK